MVGLTGPGAAQVPSEPRYLLFQVFTAAAQPEQAMGATVALSDVPNRKALETFVGNIKARIGSTGDRHRKLGFAVGPIALDHTDRQVSQLIADSFAIARALDVAVALHIDDSMFWTRHPHLGKGSAHLEWIDWDGTANTGRRIDWGPSPDRLAPQLCFNSPPVMKAVRERAALIGREVMREHRRLKQEGQEHLFAGIIAGWETMLGRDFASGRSTGYCAMTNLGYSRSRPPADLERTRAAIVKGFMELWASSLSNEGIPKHLVYNHIAFTAQGLSGTVSDHPPGEAAFSPHYRPGFSTYPSPGTLSEVHDLLKRQGPAAWASVEGTNVIPNGMPGEKTMETYLGRMFNHGARLVNIFAWGVGPVDAKRNPFRLPTEGPEALAAYRLFLASAPLREEPPRPLSLRAFQDKLQTIQSRLPPWVQRTRREHEAREIMRRLEGHIKSGDLAAADQVADELLKLTER